MLLRGGRRDVEVVLVVADMVGLGVADILIGVSSISTAFSDRSSLTSGVKSRCGVSSISTQTRSTREISWQISWSRTG